MFMLSVFVLQEIYLASLGGDGKVKDNVYRMMFAVMTNKVERGCRHQKRKVSGHKLVSCCNT